MFYYVMLKKEETTETPPSNSNASNPTAKENMEMEIGDLKRLGSLLEKDENALKKDIVKKEHFVIFGAG